MKISTTWTQADWNNALNKVWSLSRNFEEILNFGLEHNFITNSDIIHASDIYRDPNKTYEDYEVEDMVKDYPLDDLMKILQDKYSLDDIVDELDKDEIMDAIGDDELFSHIEYSGVMDCHDDEIKDQVYKEYIDEWIEETKAQEKDQINSLSNADGDELHEFICNIMGCGYYDQEEFNRNFDKLIKKLNKNNYGVKYELNIDK